MPRKNVYKIRSEVWLYPSEVSAWHFVSVPKKESKEIKECFGKNARGWGSLPVMVTIGKTSWGTSIFPDKRSEMYLLPLKADVHKKEEILVGDKIIFTLAVI